MKIESNRKLIHELEGIRANLSSCFKKMTADRRSKNPYAELGWEVLHRLETVIQKLDTDLKHQEKE